MKYFYLLFFVLAPVHLFAADVDITALPNLGTPATTTDKIVTYDSSAAEGSRITGILFDGSSSNYLNGQGGWAAITTNATHTGDVTGATALTIAADKVLESHLKAVDAAADEECLTYESTTGDFEWQTCGSGSGDVTKVSTPVNDQVGIWTGDGTLEGDADLTFDGDNLTVDGSISSAGADGSRKITMSNNSTASPTASTNEIYFEANVLSVNENGTEAIVLNDDDWAVPGAIGGTTPNTVAGTTGTFSGILRGLVGFTSSSNTATTLVAATSNSGIVQMTVAGEATFWDCESAGIGQHVTLWARDAEKIECVPASGDHFVLFDGTALDANDELDMAATAGTKVSFLCTADDTWSVFNETSTSTDGGVAD